MGALLPERGSGHLPERDSRHRPGRDPGRWLVDDLRTQDLEAWARLHRGYLDFYESTRPEKVSAVVWS